MVYHDQNRVISKGGGEVGDEVTGDLLEQADCSGGFIGLVLTLFCWHTVHPLTYLQMKEASPDHQNLVETNWQVFKMLGCPAVGWS